MPNYERLLRRVLSGQSDNNIRFSSLCGLLVRMGFNERIVGSHHVFTRLGFRERINIQPVGSKAKGYQVGQIREIFEDYPVWEWLDA
ncbi:MAG: type II toxin-antitoxin system HicA family toxin [Chloroflexi bacterium]|nr:type II toxin-antitoxin system HicA family toxin [Chloroflexota bacterium]